MNLVAYLKPVNLAEEREKFWQNNDYDPVFKYDRDGSEVEKWLKRQPQHRLLVETIENQDGKRMTLEAKKVFQTDLDFEAENAAWQYLEKKVNCDDSCEVETVVREFEKAFKFFGLDYEVELSQKVGFNIHPRCAKKKIVISRAARWDFLTLKGDVRHEMVHVIRYENGKFNGIKKGSAYLPTEEGLAAYCQNFDGEANLPSLYEQAADYMVTKKAIGGSLRDVIKMLQNWGMPLDLAWHRAIKHKYGLSDTRIPGDIMKPAMYFYWQEKIKKLSDEERLRLMVGKIRIDQLPQYPEYKGLIPKQKVMDFFRIKA